MGRKGARRSGEEMRGNGREWRSEPPNHYPNQQLVHDHTDHQLDRSAHGDGHACAVTNQKAPPGRGQGALSGTVVYGVSHVVPAEQQNCEGSCL